MKDASGRIYGAYRVQNTRQRKRESRKKDEHEKGWKIQREEREQEAKSPPRDPEDGRGEGRVMESEG